MELTNFFYATKRYFQAIGNASKYAEWLLKQEGENSSGVAVNVTRAMQLSYVHACIKVLSETLARTPLRLMRRLPDGRGAEPAVNHRLFGLMSSLPNEDQTPYTFKQSVEAQRQGWGNGYAEIIRDGPFPIEVRMLYAEQVTPEYLKDGSLVYLVTGDHRGPGKDRKTRRLMADDVLHIPNLGFNGIQGYSPIRIAREVIGQGLAAHIHTGRFYARGGSPKGVVETDMTVRAIDEFAENWREKFGQDGGSSNQTPILPRGAQWKPTMISPVDAQTLQWLQFNRSEVCGIYRVPPVFVQDLEHNTFTNAIEQDAHFGKHTMIPNYIVWEEECTRKLLTRRERGHGLFYEFDHDVIFEANIKDRYEAYHQALMDGWLLRSEVRGKEGKPMVAGMDEVLVPANMVPANRDMVPGMDNLTDEQRAFLLAFFQRHFIGALQPRDPS